MLVAANADQGRRENGKDQRHHRWTALRRRWLARQRPGLAQVPRCPLYGSSDDVVTELPELLLALPCTRYLPAPDCVVCREFEDGLAKGLCVRYQAMKVLEIADFDLGNEQDLQATHPGRRSASTMGLGGRLRSRRASGQSIWRRPEWPRLGTR